MDLKQSLETLDRATSLVQTDRAGHQQIITALQAIQAYITAEEAKTSEPVVSEKSLTKVD